MLDESDRIDTFKDSEVKAIVRGFLLTAGVPRSDVDRTSPKGNSRPLSIDEMTTMLKRVALGHDDELIRREAVDLLKSRMRPVFGAEDWEDLVVMWAERDPTLASLDSFGLSLMARFHPSRDVRVQARALEQEKDMLRIGKQTAGGATTWGPTAHQGIRPTKRR